MVPATLGTKSSGPCSPTMASCRAAIRPPVAKARMLDDVDALPMPELDVICAAAAPAFCGERRNSADCCAQTSEHRVNAANQALHQILAILDEQRTEVPQFR